MQTLLQRIKMSSSAQIKVIVAGLAILFFSLGGAPAFATITNITVLPASKNAPLGSSTSMTVTWTVTSDGTYISSPGGTFMDDLGNIFGTNSNAIYKTIPLATAVVPVQVTETVIIPAQVIQKAYQKGKSVFYYNRAFTDSSGTTSSWTVTINITSSALSGFNISSMSLVFDDDSVVRVVHAKQQLSAKAVINYSGTGLLQGVWEVAEPVSTASEPIFRPLLNVRQYLTGTGKQTLKSPVLPTAMTGLYLLRLRITVPAPAFEQPILRYVVSSGKPGEKVPVLPIGLVLPSAKTLLVPDTLFAWKPLPGVRVYQLEFYPHAMTEADKLPDLGATNSQAVPQTLPKTPPVAGIQVPGKQTKTVLSASTLSHLKSGKIYLWRVLALDGKGNVIGVSAIREIRLP